jgi:hypothetical protein
VARDILDATLTPPRANIEAPGLTVVGVPFVGGLKDVDATSEREILAAIEAGSLIETASFDAKVALPAKGRSKEIAVDVAAMANDGGTLLYGVGDDEDGRLTIPKPFRASANRLRSTVKSPLPTVATPTFSNEPPVCTTSSVVRGWHASGARALGGWFTSTLS